MAQQTSQLVMDDVSGDAAELAQVRLEVRHARRSTSYDIENPDFLVGTAPGCDLRVPGADLPPILCLLARTQSGATLRKLAPTQVVLVNGKTVNHAELKDGDRITVGALDIFVHLKAAAARNGAARKELTEQLRQVRAQVVRLQEEKDTFAREQEQWREQQLQDQRNEKDNEPVEQIRADLERQRAELTAQRQELADIRKQLYDRYQERRDRLTAMQASVEHAAKKVQERKRFIDEEAKETQRRRRELDARQADLESRTQELVQVVARLEEERKVFQESQGEVRTDLEGKLTELQVREAKYATDQQEWDERLRNYQADVLRLDRRQGDLERREQQVEARHAEIESEWHRIKEDSATLEEEATRLDELRIALEKERDRLAKQKEEQEAQGSQLGQRAALLEGQQATLAALRTRLERVREDVRRQEQQLVEERNRQEQVTQQLEEESQALWSLKSELENEQKARDSERQNLAQRSVTLEAAVAQLREAQAQCAGQESALEQRRQEMERRHANLAQNEAELQARLDQAAQTQERLDLERQALRERTLALTEAEQAREALQEQLRKRAEELAVRQKTLVEKVEAYETLLAGFDAQKAALDKSQESARQDLAARLQEIEARAALLDEEKTGLANAREDLQRQYHELDSQRRLLVEEHQQLHADQAALEDKRRAWAQEQGEARKEFERLRGLAADLFQQLPELELRAGAAVDRLAHAREQLRDHLNETHAYVRQGQEELESTRQRLRNHAAELEEHEQRLRQQQDEHRLALAAFRQQLIGWQGQIADLKRALAHDETRLERKQAQVENQEKRIDQASQELARQVENVQEQEKSVAERRQEVDRHLVDMREWYRHKLRDLAEVDLQTAQASAAPAPGDDGEAVIVPFRRHLLAVPDPAQPGDERLGDLLREHELVEQETLTALLAEARRQRRSLRQVLLASGAITLYQLALIEAGNVGGLMLGPVRVVDRLRASVHETVYRVFDPRRGREAVLRHLSDAADPARVDEYRRCFEQLQGGDVHRQATWEVYDLMGRPAVLQEWVTGLPAGDWPPLAAAPGVCYRLLTQAALGLAAAHRQGLVHGSLGEASLVLTGEGTIKICGLGEPSWLRGHDEGVSSPAADLSALGRIAASWCMPAAVRKGAKAKPLPPPLVAILDRLSGAQPPAYADAQELLDNLDQAGADIPANAEAWDRLLKHVRDHAAPEATLRLSA